VNQPGLESAGEGRRGHRRFPHLTRADVVLLDELERTRGRAAAREFERLVRAQHASDRAFRRHITVETDLGADVDVVIAKRLAPPAGGGRRVDTA